MNRRISTIPEKKQLLLIIVLAVGVFILDIHLPLGVAGGVPYVIPVLLSVWLLTPRITGYLVLFCAGLTIGGLILSPPGKEPLWMILINRIYGLVATGLMALVHYLLKKVEHLTVLKERQQVAWELHDRLAQMMGGITARAAATREFLAKGQSEEAQQQLDTVLHLSDKVTTDLRATIQQLHHEPFRSAFLVQPSQSVHRLAAEANISVEVDLTDVETPLPLSSQAALQITGILREAFRNIRNHAGVEDGAVVIRNKESTVEIAITDNGRGIPENQLQPKPDHFGIQTMKQRAESIGGHFDIRSRSGQGTTITVQIPKERE
ncbi:MAG TPA: ATP-binding protein [bacterium]|nr:ATP-binding protein [bacterium]